MKLDLYPTLLAFQLRTQLRQQQFVEGGCKDISGFVGGNLEDARAVAKEISDLHQAEHERLMELPEALCKGSERPA